MADRKKEELVGSLEGLSVHGWPKVISSPTWKRRIVWLACCALASGYFIYFAVQIVNSYLKFETYTAVNVNPKNSLALPAVTICNTNYMGVLDPVSQGPEFQVLPKNCSNYTESDFVNEKNRKYFEIGCRMFMGRSRTAFLAAKSGKFRFPENFAFLPHSWPCFTLNRKENLIQLDANEREGYRMILFFNESETDSEKIFENDFFLQDERRGIFIDIHDAAEHYHKSIGIYLMPGFHTMVQLRKKVQVKLGFPYSSNCYKDEPTLPISGKYTVERCRFQCFAKDVYKKCGLVPSNLKLNFDKSEIPKRNVTDSDIRCYQSAIFAYNTSECHCPPPCRKVSFEKEVSYNKWPKEWQLRHFAPVLSEVTNIPQREISIELLRKHLIFLSIYYGELTETEEKDMEAYCSAKALSDFGGQMGIFLGASFISLFEILFLIITTIFNWYTTRQEKGTKVLSLRD